MSSTFIGADAVDPYYDLRAFPLDDVEEFGCSGGGWVAWFRYSGNQAIAGALLARLLSHALEHGLPSWPIHAMNLCGCATLCGIANDANWPRATLYVRNSADATCKQCQAVPGEDDEPRTQKGRGC